MGVAAISFRIMGTVSVITVFVVVTVIRGDVALPVVLITIVRLTVFVGLNVPRLVNRSLPFVAPVYVDAVRLNTAISCTVLVAAQCGGRECLKGSGHASIVATLRASVPSVVIDTVKLFTTAVNITFCSSISLVSSVYGLLTENTIVDVFYMALVLPTVFVLFSGMVTGAALNFGPGGASVSRTTMW